MAAHISRKRGFPGMKKPIRSAASQTLIQCKVFTRGRLSGHFPCCQKQSSQQGFRWIKWRIIDGWNWEIFLESTLRRDFSRALEWRTLDSEPQSTLYTSVSLMTVQERTVAKGCVCAWEMSNSKQYTQLNHGTWSWPYSGGQVVISWSAWACFSINWKSKVHFYSIWPMFNSILGS